MKRLTQLGKPMDLVVDDLDYLILWKSVKEEGPWRYDIDSKFLLDKNKEFILNV